MVGVVFKGAESREVEGLKLQRAVNTFADSYINDGEAVMIVLTDCFEPGADLVSKEVSFGRRGSVGRL